MVNRLPRILRLLTLLFAGAQLAWPAIAAISDGETARSASAAGMHVEAPGTGDCTPPHAADCAICRFLSTSAGSAAESSTDFAGLGLRLALEGVDDGFMSSTLGEVHQSRAPPTV